MKTNRHLLRAVTIVVVLTSLVWSHPVGAATRYSAFGNLTVGDCQFAAAANLVKMEWPRAAITPAQVLHAYRTSQETGIDYLLATGFAGHHALSVAPISTPAQIIAAVHAGGVVAGVMNGTHEVAVVGAGVRGVTYVTWGTVVTVTWAQWSRLSSASGAAYAVTWAPPGTVTVTFVGSYETTSMAPETYPTGTVAPLSPLLFDNGGYTFVEWNTRGDGSGVAYAANAPYRFTQGAILYAIWVYTGARSSPPSSLP